MLLYSAGYIIPISIIHWFEIEWGLKINSIIIIIIIIIIYIYFFFSSHAILIKIVL